MRSKNASMQKENATVQIDGDETVKAAKRNIFQASIKTIVKILRFNWLKIKGQRALTAIRTNKT